MNEKSQVSFYPNLSCSPDFCEAWEDWVADRAERGKPLTDRAAKMGLKLLSKYGPEVGIRTITNSIGRWEGLFPEQFADDPTKPPDELDMAVESVRKHLEPLGVCWSTSWSTSVRRNLSESVSLENMLSIVQSDVNNAIDAGKPFLDAVLQQRMVRLALARRVEKKYAQREEVLELSPEAVEIETQLREAFPDKSSNWINYRAGLVLSGNSTVGLIIRENSS